MNKDKAKGKRKLQPEDWCFECKDGGELVICDYQNCGKVYHRSCLGKDESFLDYADSWVCAWHYCLNCKKSSKAFCLGCPNAVCKRCSTAAKFTIVKGEKGLCSDCMELVVIIEQNLDHDSEGNKISLDGKETYEGLFKEYWEIIKGCEGLTSDDISAAQSNYKKINNSLTRKNVNGGGGGAKQNDSVPGDSGYEDYMGKHKSTKRKKSNSWTQKNVNEGEEEKQNDFLSRDCDYENFLGKPSSTKRKKSNSLTQKIVYEGEEEKQYDSESGDSDCEDYRRRRNSTERKKSNSLEFDGWASKPLISFLDSIGQNSIGPLTQWRVRSLIFEYIKEKKLYHPKDKKKFLPDEKLFPIFRKKVVSQKRIYPLLERHLTVNLDRDEEENSDQNISSPSENYLNDQKSCKEGKLSGLVGKPLLKKGDFFMKPSTFASISVGNINLIYLKQSLVVELSKQPESFMSKVVGAFVRVKVESSGSGQMKSYHLVRVVGVILDEILKGILLQVSFMPNAIPISELSDEDFTEQECQALQQKVKANLLQKLTVVELEEKVKILHDDITKHRIAKRLIQLQNQIDRANLRGRHREKFALLDEREKLEQSLKQEELLKVPSVIPEFVGAEYDPEAHDAAVLFGRTNLLRTNMLQ